jgi:hypothetical protein
VATGVASVEVYVMAKSAPATRGTEQVQQLISEEEKAAGDFSQVWHARTFCESLGDGQTDPSASSGDEDELA